MTAVDGYALRPTEDQINQLKDLKAELPGVNARIKELIEKDLPAANKQIDASGVQVLSDTEKSTAGAQGEHAADNDDDDDV